MSAAVTIDPGVRDVGIAVWDDDAELRHAMLVRAGRSSWPALAVQVAAAVESYYLDITDVVIEKPQVYTQNKLKGDPNALITLAMSAGGIVVAILNQFPDVKVTELLPRDWKGQPPKEISTARTKKLLTPAEHAQIDLPIKSLQHNVWDAIGIGLHWHRRRRGK